MEYKKKRVKKWISYMICINSFDFFLNFFLFLLLLWSYTYHIKSRSPLSVRETLKALKALYFSQFHAPTLTYTFAVKKTGVIKHF